MIPGLSWDQDIHCQKVNDVATEVLLVIAETTCHNTTSDSDDAIFADLWRQGAQTQWSLSGRWLITNCTMTVFLQKSCIHMNVYITWNTIKLFTVTPEQVSIFIMKSESVHALICANFRHSREALRLHDYSYTFPCITIQATFMWGTTL